MLIKIEIGQFTKITELSDIYIIFFDTLLVIAAQKCNIYCPIKLPSNL